MSCQWIDERLFDEDCREAQLHRGPVPEDVSAHLATCPACRSSWSEAGEEMNALRSALVLPVPLSQRLSYLEIPSSHGQTTDLLDPYLASRALVAGTLGAVLAGGAFSAPPVWQTAAFALVLGWAYALAWSKRSGLGGQLLRRVLPWRMV